MGVWRGAQRVVWERGRLGMGSKVERGAWSVERNWVAECGSVEGRRACHALGVGICPFVWGSGLALSRGSSGGRGRWFRWDERREVALGEMSTVGARREREKAGCSRGGRCPWYYGDDAG